ncbi:MAG: hypothetical protein WBA46_06395 [Thermomicrobiales bacterium]
MTALLRWLFHRMYRVPRKPLVCKCGTVAHPADYFCSECGARVR